MIPELIEMVMGAGVRVGPLYPMDRGRAGVCSCRKGEHCESPAKHPITRNGKDDFSTDGARVAWWAESQPGCNWGGRPPEGVFILDVDPRNGGDESLAKVELDHGPLPLTLTARTGGGGLHLWFTGTTSRGKLSGYPGLDVKDHGGYVVLPPSVHASGRPYEWLDVREAAHSPNWLHELLNPPVERISKSRFVHPAHLINHVAGLTSDRNNQLFWAACRIAEQGGDPFVLEGAARACGLDPSEYVKTLRSAAKTYGLVN